MIKPANISKKAHNVKVLFLFLLCLTLISCETNNPNKPFDGQVAKVKELNNWMCNNLGLEVDAIKKDTQMFEDYSSPEYFTLKYKEFKVQVVGFWNGMSKMMWNSREIKSELVPAYEVEKYLTATKDEVPEIEKLSCQNEVKDWHDAVNQRLREGPYQTTLTEKIHDFFQTLFNQIEDILNLGLASIFALFGTWVSYKGFKSFVATKSIFDLVISIIFSGAFGLIAILIKFAFNVKSIGNLTIWWTSSLAFIFISLAIAVVKSIQP